MTRLTGTPSSFPDVATDDVLVQLEFTGTLDVVAGYAAGPLGAERVRQRRPSADAARINAELEQVDQLALLLRGGDPLRPDPVGDLSDVLRVLAIEGGVLDGAALAELRRALDAMQAVAGDLTRVERDAPSLAPLRVPVPPRDLSRAIGRAIESDGTVKDDASAEIVRARKQVRDRRERLVSFLEGLLRSLGHHASSDAAVTLRGGRYVIPVSRDARSRVGGIVHGESGSGATLFVEPSAGVELGNDLAEAEAAEARAVQRLFRTLTEGARPHSAAIAAGWEMCIAVDDLFARARAAVEWKAQRPQVGPSGGLAIRDGRHPLLLLELGSAVPFDLVLEPHERGLVISGPNTGGKTVLLKAVGLTAMLAQAGIIPAVGTGTELPVFSRVFTDIGDRQSIAESLSTFSARLQSLRGILDQADGTSLVLLDELGGGTDPAEGAALAAAVVMALVSRGTLTVATTHLSQLKELASANPAVVNASLRFDGAGMRPTYELIKGIPGRSYGLAIARRLGLPDAVLRDADSRRSEGEKSLDALLAGLEEKTAQLRQREEEVGERETALREARADLESLRAELEQRHAGLEEQTRELERSGREQARQFLLQARRRVDEALGIARAAVSEASAREARRLVEEGVQAEAEAVKKLRAAAAAKGWTVRGKGEEGRGKSESAPVMTRRRAAPEAPAAASEIDVRGLTGDEAESIVVRALDAAILGDLPALRIIHGKGTGALRERVAAILKRDRRVSGFQLAPAPQGGSGVTVAELG